VHKINFLLVNQILFVSFFDYVPENLVTPLKNFFESIYRNFDYNLLSQVTINGKKPAYIDVTSSPINLVP